MDEEKIAAALRVACEDETIALERRLGGELLADIPASRLVAVIESLQEMHALHHLSAISGVADSGGLRVYYHLWLGAGLTLRVACPREQPILPTLSDLFPIANWYEREVHDMFGVEFVGHPNLRPLLLPEGWTMGPPMRDGGKR